jgi:hypothetical protein
LSAGASEKRRFGGGADAAGAGSVWVRGGGEERRFFVGEPYERALDIEAEAAEELEEPGVFV